MTTHINLCLLCGTTNIVSACMKLILRYLVYIPCYKILAIFILSSCLMISIVLGVNLNIYQASLHGNNLWHTYQILNILCKREWMRIASIYQEIFMSIVIHGIQSFVCPIHEIKYYCLVVDLKILASYYHCFQNLKSNSSLIFVITSCPILSSILKIPNHFIKS